MPVRHGIQITDEQNGNEIFISVSKDKYELQLHKDDGEWSVLYFSQADGDALRKWLEENRAG